LTGERRVEWNTFCTPASGLRAFELFLINAIVPSRRFRNGVVHPERH
jgi:hypothetical protein